MFSKEFNELTSKLGVSNKAIMDAVETINPLRLAINEEFGSKEEGCYRQRSIQRCLDAKVDFVSEANTITEMAKRFMKIVNPLTGNEMKYVGGGGNYETMTLRFLDEQTNDVVSITLSNDAIGFTPRKY